MCLGILLLFTGALQAAPAVLVTIKPIYGLTAYLMQEVGEPTLLLPDNASPHYYAFKPSDRDKLAHADLFIFIDYEMESFLKATQLANIPQVLQLSKLPALHKLPTRNPKHDHTHDHAHSHDHAHGHIHGATDWHIWLDIDNAKVISEAIAAQLMLLDPEHKTQYQHNLTQLLAELTSLDQQLQRELTPLHDASFMVYHDAYQYFATRYALKLPAVLHWQPEVPITAKQLGNIQTQVTEQQITCLFLEPQFDNPKLVQLAEQLQLSVYQLDPIGSHLAKDKQAYFQLLKDLSNALNSCCGPLIKGETSESVLPLLKQR